MKIKDSRSVMDNIADFVSKYSHRSHHKIKKICSLINTSFGINHFWHYRISSNGSFYVTCSQPDKMGKFIENELHLKNPFYTDPKLFLPGQFYTRSVGTKSYINGADLMKEQANIDKHYLVIRKPAIDICEGFGFAANPLGNSLDEVVATAPHIFQEFIDFYKEEMKKDLSYLIDQRTSILPLLDKTFYHENETHRKLKAQQIRYQTFLSQIHKPAFHDVLTKREKECIKLYLDGLTATETGNRLHISHRTVESHFDHIKDKLNLMNKRELFKISGFRSPASSGHDSIISSIG